MIKPTNGHAPPPSSIEYWRIRFAPLLSDRLFQAVLIVKLVLAFFSGSFFLRDLFVPFVDYFINSGFGNPWDHFYHQGHLDIFPYSGVMLMLISIPQVVLGWIASADWFDSQNIKMFLIRVPLLAGDFVILAVLSRWFISRQRQVIWYYWCSPIFIYITYVHGQLDVLPMAFLFVALFFLFRRRPIVSGIAIGLGIACKFHLLLSLVLFGFHFFKSSGGLRQRLSHFLPFVVSCLATVTVSLWPAFGSEGYRKLVLQNPKSLSLFDLKIGFSNGLYVFPTIFVLVVVLLRFASAPQTGRDLFVYFQALLYSILVLLIVPMPGWYYWALPFVCYYMIRQGTSDRLAFWTFNLLYFLYFLPFEWGSSGSQWHIDRLETPSQLQSFVFTSLQGSWALLIYLVFKNGIRPHRSYAQKLSSVLVGIAGESGAGKDRLSKSLTGLLGKEFCAQNDGDDYHLWERGNEMWGKLTHLDPNANDMYRAISDIERLGRGQSISKSQYDHGTGKFTEKRSLLAKPFVFFVGLHAFYLKRSRDLIPIKIYLDPQESLRTYWKVVRDRQKRGYTKEKVLDQIAARQKDAKKYIEPQRQFADWILSYQAQSDLCLEDEVAREISLRSVHHIRNDVDLTQLIDSLREIPTLKVGWSLSDDMNMQTVVVEGQISALDVEGISYNINPDLLDQYSGERLCWESGLDGVNQLIFARLLQDYL